MLKFYGRSSSDSVQKALWMLAETGEAFEHIQLGGRFGAHLTMADFPSGATLYRFFEMSIERPALPNIARWYERLKAREAYQRAVMVPFDELRGRLAY